MLSFFSFRSSLKSVLINCSLLLLLQSSHSSRTGQWPSNLFQFPLLFKSFSAFCQFSPSSFFPICCKLKIVPQKAITAVVKSLNITARLYTQREYNNLQLLDYTHRVSFVTITTYNCLHSQELCSCNVLKMTKSTLANSKVAKSAQKYREAPDCGLCHLLGALLPELLIFNPEILGGNQTACTSFIATLFLVIWI